MNKLKTAIIDIGSNTIRLVLFSYSKEAGIHEFGNIKTVARLRRYILPNGEMSEEGIIVLKNTLLSFKEILKDYNVTNVKAAATAAIRQATNNQEILSRMERETGIKIHLLSEEEEAYYGYLAVVNSMDTLSAVTVDIGGGSTEITLFENKKMQHCISFPFGTVSLKQNFVSGDKINEKEKERLRQYVKKNFESLRWIKNVGLPIISIGGSGRNLAQIHQHINNYPISGVHHYEMNSKALVDLSNYLKEFSYEELKQIDGLSSDRADIIEIALEVFRALMEIVNTDSFQISRRGLREGLIMERVLQSNPDAFDPFNIFEDTARRLAFKYGRTEDETNTLVYLAGKLYLECCRINHFQYNEEHLDLIKKAARVYSIGDYIELDSSNQHTFYLIANQSISGLPHPKRVKIALLASYKNRDYFRRLIHPFTSWFTREEIRAMKDYGALLKFVYALNSSKRNVVKDIKLIVNNGFISIYISTTDSAVAEMYRAEIQKKHLERVFKKRVEIGFIHEGWNDYDS